MIVRNIGIAVADCAIDGFSVDCGLDEESGVLSGWMSLGRTVGTVLGAVAGGNIALNQGYGAALWALAAFAVRRASGARRHRERQPWVHADKY